MRTPEHLRALAAAEGEHLARQLLKTFDTTRHRVLAIGLGDVGLAVHWDVPRDGQLDPDELPIEAFHDLDDAGDGNGKLSFRELAKAFMASAGLLWPIAVPIMLGALACWWRATWGVWHMWLARREVIALLDRALQPPEVLTNTPA